MLQIIPFDSCNPPSYLLAGFDLYPDLARGSDLKLELTLALQEVFSPNMTLR